MQLAPEFQFTHCGVVMANGDTHLGCKRHCRDMADLSFILGMLFSELDSQAFIITDKKRRQAVNTFKPGAPLTNSN